METPASRIRSSRPRSLAKLLHLDAEPEKLWLPSELGSILRHQLAADVRDELARCHPDLEERASQVVDPSGISFEEALMSPGTSREILLLVKEFGKLHWHAHESGIPKEVSMTIYLAAIAASMARDLPPITQMSFDSLRSGLDWVHLQDWIPDSLRSLCSQAREKLPPN